MRRLTACALLLGCGGFETPPPPPPDSGPSGDGPSTAECAAENDDPLPGTHPVGLRVSGNRIVDGAGNQVVLRGVNRSGSEYECKKGSGFFEGPCDEASVRAIASWNVNAVRVPLNESCWLGNPGIPGSLSGDNYRRAIESYVFLLHKYGIVPILDLHWSATGDEPAGDLSPMPHATKAPEFWRQVAQAFKDDTGVVFEPFNEPFPGRNGDSDEAWQCWRDGCTAEPWSGAPYEAAGMQALVDAIREVGAEQLILLGGVQYSNGLSRWAEFKPQDPLNNLAPAWHVYNFNHCAGVECWNGAPAALAAEYPLVATEIGQNDCKGDFVSALTQFLDGHGGGYLAWTWHDLGPCQPGTGGSDGAPWSLITDYTSPEPNSDYARAFRDHLLAAP